MNSQMNLVFVHSNSHSASPLISSIVSRCALSSRGSFDSRLTMDGRSDNRDEVIDGRETGNPNSIGVIAVLLVMMLQMKKEINEKAEQIDLLKTENGQLKDELECSKKEIQKLECPLLSLPDEIIGYILSFLSIKDRMKARLCKRMDNIEQEFNYFVPKLLITERSRYDHLRFNNQYFMNHQQYFCLLQENVYSIDFFERLIQNAKFGYLAISIPFVARGFIMNLLSLVKEMNIVELDLYIGPFWNDEAILEDSFLIGLVDTRYKLMLTRIGHTTANGLYAIYLRIVERVCKMHTIYIGHIATEKMSEFLQMIGIRLEGGVVHSTRFIEAFDCPVEDEFVNKHIFDGNIEMIIDTIGTVTCFEIRLYETEEDLAKAKAMKDYVKIEIVHE